ncbi:Agamous-like MADS-box protein AGL62 [Linum grandiflorum]
MKFTIINIHDYNSINNNNDDINNNTPAKKTKGRQTIQMKKIESDTNRLITFSKRRSGIYKKGSELVTLTGYFSPAGKAFTFAYPSFDYIVTRYLSQLHQQHQDLSMPYAMEVFRHARIQQLTNRYNDILDQYENDRRKERTLMARLDGKALRNWWNISIDDVQGHEIEGFENACMEMRNRVEERKMKITLGINRFVPTNLINNYNTNAEELQNHMEEDYDIGSTIRDKIIPHAVSWYTGEAVQPDGLDDEDDDDIDLDNDDEDDIEEEDEDDEGKNKSLLQLPEDMAPQTELMMNMGRPNLVQSLPNMGQPNLVPPVPNFSIVGVRLLVQFRWSDRTVVVKLRLSVHLPWSDQAVAVMRVLVRRRCLLSLI